MRGLDASLSNAFPSPQSGESVGLLGKLQNYIIFSTSRALLTRSGR